MDVQNLRGNYPKLISHLERNGYSRDYIRAFKSEINHILSEPNPEKWSSYVDVYQGYVEKATPRFYLRLKRRILGALEHFDLYGQYPDGRHRPGIIPRGKYHLLTQEFKNAIDFYRIAEKVRHKKDSTINGEAGSAANFLHDLQQAGFDAFEKITEEAVLSVFILPDGKLRYGYSFKKNVAAVFKACLPQAPETFAKILAYRKHRLLDG